MTNLWNTEHADVAANAAQLVYDSERYRGLLYPRSNALIVTFSHYVAGKTNFPAPKPSKLFQRLGLSELNIASRRNDWYSSVESCALFDAVGKEIEPFDDVIFYGFSMGAYAALILGSLFSEKSRIVSISPQYSIDPSVCTFENRWNTEFSENNNFILPMDDYKNTNLKGFVLYDQFHAQDAQHVALIRSVFPNVKYLTLSFGGHPCTRPLADNKSISQFGKEIIKPKPNMSAIKGYYRDARMTSPTFLVNAGLAICGKNPQLAILLLEELLTLPNTTSRQRFKALAELYRIKKDPALFKEMELLFAHTPNPPPRWKRQIKAIRQQPE